MEYIEGVTTHEEMILDLVARVEELERKLSLPAETFPVGKVNRTPQYIVIEEDGF